MATFIESFKNKAICIPMLQRDYVQGLDEGIITPFLESLMDTAKDTDLNYIYGYDESDGFIPVDGQQRLITLWLLHLYVASAAKRADEFKVKLSFQSREYAKYFASCLKEHIGGCLSCKEIEDTIEDAPWFIKSWKSSKTVCAMLRTLYYIHRCAQGKDMAALWERLKSGSPGISFSFLNMGGYSGLDDDIYLKMNGRGRALSVYENLKSWIDNGADADWKRCIDNDWAELFWRNRHRKDGKAENIETDDEALHCFCNLLILYWARKEAALEESIKEHEGALREYLDLNNKADIKSVLFERLSKGVLPSLIWLERLRLVNGEFRCFACDALNGICARESFINSQIGSAEDSRYLYTGSDADNTLIYDLLLSGGSFGRTLPLLYAVICLLNDLSDDEVIYRRLRTIRNLVLNTRIDSSNFARILSDIKAFAGSGDLCVLYSFNGEQIAEERIKNKTEYEDIYPLMGEIENSRIFRGAIRFLLLDGEGKEDMQAFSVKADNAAKYFNDGGVCEEYKLESKLLRRYISLLDDDDSWYAVTFDSEGDSWRKHLLDKRLLRQTDALLRMDDALKYNYAGFTSRNTDVKKRYAQTFLVRHDIFTAAVNGCQAHLYSRFCRGSVTLYPYNVKAGWKFYVIHPRADLLFNEALGITFRDNNLEKCRDIRLLFGKIIFFTYNNRCFEWYDAPNRNDGDVYLKGDNWGDYVRRPAVAPGATDETEIFYSFRIDDTYFDAPEEKLPEFKDRLETLIKECERDNTEQLKS